jgi:hypothetical protein
MERLHKGDRVRASVARYRLPVGTTGAIQRVFRATPEVYEVAFDDVPQPVIMYRYELEPAEAEQDAGS